MILKNRWWWLLGLFLLAVAGFALRTFWVAGQFKSIQPHFAGKCALVPGVLSSEDITIDYTSGLAFISGADRDPARKEHPRQGAIWGLSLRDPESRPVDLTGKLPFSFQPHGIGLYRGQGQVLLFVVNHRAGPGPRSPHRVEVFRLQEGRLKHMRSIRGDLLVSPNDVIPLDAERFFVSNDHGSKTGPGRLLEDYLQLPWSNVLFYDGKGFRVAAEGLHYANGVNITPDGKRLLVAETLARGISVYQLDRRQGLLERERFLDLESGVDNIEVGPQGNLWVGAHPKLLAFVAHAANPARLSPSQVFRLTPEGPSWRLEEVYLSQGRPLSGSSAAARWGGNLLIGAAVEPGLLRCRLP